MVAGATPKDIVQKISADVISATQATDVRRKLADFGYEVDPLDSAAFEAFIRAEIESKGRLVRSSDAKFE